MENIKNDAAPANLMEYLYLAGDLKYEISTLTLNISHGHQPGDFFRNAYGMH